MSQFHRIDTLDNDATDEQLDKLEKLAQSRLGSDETHRILVDEATDIVSQLLDERAVTESAEEINTELRDEITDILLDRIKIQQRKNISPETESDAHDRLSEVIATRVDKIMADVKITEEDIYIEASNITTEPDPDVVYERELDV